MAGDGRVFRAGDAWGSGVLARRPPAVGAGPGVSALREGAPRGRSPSAPGRTSPRAVLPTLRGVSASKILRVGRVRSWGAAQTLGGPGRGVALERVGKAAWGWAGDLAAGGGAGRPWAGVCPGGAEAQVGALPVRAVAGAWASAEGPRCPGWGCPRGPRSSCSFTGRRRLINYPPPPS